MADQERKIVRRDKGSEETPTGAPAASAKGEKIKKDLDELLDEIDAVLEQNAEEFVKSYVQRGGQ
jgi:ubiquitin-like protein Pup